MSDPAGQAESAPPDTSAQPKSHRDRAFLAAKQSLLECPHVAPVQALVREVRAARGTEHVPYVDPVSGGVGARVLFVLESPPGGAALRSGMLSPDNGDETAGPEMSQPGDTTLAAYEAGARVYVETSARPAPSLVAYLDQLAGLVGAGHVLELGSGPGWDAEHLESRGVRVTRTDAAAAFVSRLRSQGHDARLLDVRTGDLGGPYAAVLANAVLLHLTRPEFESVLQRAREAVIGEGLLAFTLKEGDGAGWSEEKLGLPRHFTFWREQAVRQVLARTGWAPVSIDHAAGRSAPWLYVIARAAAPRPA